MNASRRYFFKQLLGAATLAGITAFPYAIQLSTHTPLVPNAAHAQGKGTGGNGNAGSGNGKGGGGSGNGNGGNAGGNRNGAMGSTSGNTNSGRARSRGASPPEAGIEHENGMRETIHKGRYEMRDAQGRTIVNRPATAMDYLRLKMAH